MDVQSGARKQSYGQSCKMRFKRARSQKPFGAPPFHQFKCSPVSIVLKKDLAKVHLIHNLSHPFGGNSVNVLISPEEEAVQYQRFEDFIGMVRRAGHRAELGKFDLTDVYKYVLVHPDY